MSFTEAALRESMRIETLVPSSVPHKAMEETTFLGYTVPKDTIMIAGLYAFHNDEKLWGDPFTFRPERFLDDQGKLSLKKDITFPFGAGKRLCAGETFARNVLFLFGSALYQNFDIQVKPGEKLPDVNKNHTGLIIYIKDFYCKFVPR